MLAFIGAHSLPLAAIALAGYLVLGAVMPIASSKLCGNAGRASRDAAGSISAYVLDGLRGLAETVQFAGVSKRSAGLAAQTDAMGSTDRSLHVRSAAVEGLADAFVLLTSLAMIATSLGLFAAGDLSLSSAFICSFAYLSSFGPVLAVCRLGTSTLLKLLMRFWDPTSGAVKMSGRDLRGVNTVSLRSSIGYMTQDTHLFVGTIGDNLRIARELVSHRSSTCAFADRFYSVERGRIS